MTKQLLDLFAGLGGFSQAFEESEEWEVTTVDIEPEFNPDIQADVMDLRPSDFEKDFDVILASPPCTEFSFAASRYEKFIEAEPQTPKARESVLLVYHTIGLIKSLNPDYWFLENPQGWLRHIIGEPEGRVTYCQYGTDYMKPTDLWGDHPTGFSYLSCSYGDDCHKYNTDNDHNGLGNLDVTGTKDSSERAFVPYDLSKAILEAIEAAYDGPTVEQVTLEQSH